MSTTLLAVVYAVLVETSLTKTKIGKIIMASTFVTDFGTAVWLSVLFVRPDLHTLWFVVVSIAMIALAPKTAP